MHVHTSDIAILFYVNHELHSWDMHCSGAQSWLLYRDSWQPLLCT